VPTCKVSQRLCWTALASVVSMTALSPPSRMCGTTCQELAITIIVGVLDRRHTFSDWRAPASGLELLIWSRSSGIHEGVAARPTLYA
jgi:hypothetical protein